jgi:plasmid stabilization system protein ParE
MSGYRLTGEAIGDLEAITQTIAEREGWDRSMNVEQELFDAFDRLAINPGIGHRRSDLTRLPVFFYAIEPFLIVHDRDHDPLRIIAVIHASRNVRKLLRKRFRRN